MFPKTIDNDVNATDQTFGFDTAVDTVMEALDRLHTTAESHHRIMVVEVIWGRYAGWIALHSGLAGGADVILIPEIPYDVEVIAKKNPASLPPGQAFQFGDRGRRAVEKAGERIVAAHIEESTDPIRLGGVGQVVADQLARVTGLESRTTVLGHLQRGGSPKAFDRILTTRLGVRAMEAASEGPGIRWWP